METITTVFVITLLVMWFVCVGMVFYLATRPNKDEGAIICFSMFILFIPWLILGIGLAN